MRDGSALLGRGCRRARSGPGDRRHGHRRHHQRRPVVEGAACRRGEHAAVERCLVPHRHRVHGGRLQRGIVARKRRRRLDDRCRRHVVGRVDTAERSRGLERDLRQPGRLHRGRERRRLDVVHPQRRLRSELDAGGQPSATLPARERSHVRAGWYLHRRRLRPDQQRPRGGRGRGQRRRRADLGVGRRAFRAWRVAEYGLHLRLRLPCRRHDRDDGQRRRPRQG